jgi:hypothetical protein
VLSAEATNTNFADGLLDIFIIGHRIPKIPADDYDKQTAVDVINLTRLILEYASDKI